MITWHSITSTEYNEADINKKTDDKIYYLTDTQQIYRGTKNFTESVTLYTELPENPATKRLYINQNTLEGKVWDGEKWINVIQNIGLLTDNGSIIFNDIISNEAKNKNSIISGSNNKSRISNSHVEGLKNNLTALYGFKIISKDNNFNAETRLSTIILDSVEGIEAGMIYNVFEKVITEEKTYTEKYRGNINSVDTETNKVTIYSSQSDSEFPVSAELSEYSPIGYFIVNGGTIGSTKIIDRSNEFSTHTEGASNISYFQSHAEGIGVKALGYASHSEGYYTQSLGERSHSEGYRTKAQGHESHAEGASTLTTGSYSHAEGVNTQSNGESAHAEGRSTNANARCSHAEGTETIADGRSSHTEGTSTKAQAENAHAEGFSSIAKGINSHSEGKLTEANGYCSHAEGESSIADGDRSHAEGSGTKAKHLCSHTEGVGTESSSSYQHVGGTYNVVDDGSKGYLEIIGNGTDENNLSNARTLDKKGNAWFANIVKVGGTSFSDSNAKELATKEYVDSVTIPTATLDALTSRIAALETTVAELQTRLEFKSLVYTENNNA